MRAFSLLLLGISFVGTSALGCSTSSATSVITPITGITISANDLTKQLGCGSQGTQLYRYAVTVDALTVPEAGVMESIAHGIYDCYVDATFVRNSDDFSKPFQLSAYDATAKFRLNVVAFSASEYEAQKADIESFSGSAPVTKDQLTKLRGFSWVCEAQMRLDVLSTAVCHPSKL